MQLGKKFAHYNVKPNKLFMGEQANFLLMWCGGSTEADCKVLSCINYKRMNGQVAFSMCAARNLESSSRYFATTRWHSNTLQNFYPGKSDRLKL